jgi:hypothetical protein
MVIAALRARTRLCDALRHEQCIMTSRAWSWRKTRNHDAGPSTNIAGGDIKDRQLLQPSAATICDQVLRMAA